MPETFTIPNAGFDINGNLVSKTIEIPAGYAVLEQAMVESDAYIAIPRDDDELVFSDYIDQYGETFYVNAADQAFEDADDQGGIIFPIDYQSWFSNAAWSNVSLGDNVYLPFTLGDLGSWITEHDGDEYLPDSTMLHITQTEEAYPFNNCTWYYKTTALVPGYLRYRLANGTTGTVPENILAIFNIASTSQLPKLVNQSDLLAYLSTQIADMTGKISATHKKHRASVEFLQKSIKNKSNSVDFIESNIAAINRDKELVSKVDDLVPKEIYNTTATTATITQLRDGRVYRYKQPLSALTVNAVERGINGSVIMFEATDQAISVRNAYIDIGGSETWFNEDWDGSETYAPNWRLTCQNLSATGADRVYRLVTDDYINGWDDLFEGETVNWDGEYNYNTGIPEVTWTFEAKCYPQLNEDTEIYYNEDENESYTASDYNVPLAAYGNNRWLITARCYCTVEGGEEGTEGSPNKVRLYFVEYDDSYDPNDPEYVDERERLEIEFEANEDGAFVNNDYGFELVCDISETWILRDSGGNDLLTISGSEFYTDYFSMFDGGNAFSGDTATIDGIEYELDHTEAEEGEEASEGNYYWREFYFKAAYAYSAEETTDIDNVTWVLNTANGFNPAQCLPGGYRAVLDERVEFDTLSNCYARMTHVSTQTNPTISLPNTLHIAKQPSSFSTGATQAGKSYVLSFWNNILTAVEIVKGSATL